MSCDNGNCKDCATVKGAIAYFKGCRDGDWNDPCQDTLNAYLNMAIEALEKQQPETTPLTLEDGFDIKNADGSPIDYDALGKKYKDQLCYCDIDGFYIGEDGQLILMDDCGKSVPVDRGDYHIVAREPVIK